MGRQAFGTRVVYRETFLQIQQRPLQHLVRKELESWKSGISEPIHSSTAEKNEYQTPVQDLRCQSGPSAKDSVIFSGGDSSKNYGADQQRLQISDLHFDKFPTHQQLLLAGRQDSILRYVLAHIFLRKLCCGSKKWRLLNQWMI